MNFTQEHSEDGVTERLFDLTVVGQVVPAVLWTPEGARGPRPLVLIGHGGSQHKKAPAVLGNAKRYVKSLGFAVAAIDAPGHGARVSPEEAAVFAAEIRAQMAGGGMGGEPLKAMMRRAVQAEPEWKAALDAAQSLEFVGAAGPTGYLGLSMGAMLGIPFVAHEPRIKVAVFGVAGVRPEISELAEAARQITIPIELAAQWDDELVPRHAALDLFNAFGSTEKTLHFNPGGHAAIPVFERSSWEAFFARHLNTANR